MVRSIEWPLGVPPALAEHVIALTIDSPFQAVVLPTERVSVILTRSAGNMRLVPLLAAYPVVEGAGVHRAERDVRPLADIFQQVDLTRVRPKPKVTVAWNLGRACWKQPCCSPCAHRGRHARAELDQAVSEVEAAVGLQPSGRIWERISRLGLGANTEDTILQPHVIGAVRVPLNFRVAPAR
eukprot:6504290-Prymnesium_polylepis.1